MKKTTPTDAERLAKIKAGIPYGATHAELRWLVKLVEKLLKERNGNSGGSGKTSKPRG
jgi:hypothetical protein